jgi:hypothetical protein
MSDTVTIPRTRFSIADSARAWNEWGANCGPGAIAAIAGMTLDELRPHMGDFERKGYTNLTLMWEVLDRLGLKWRKIMRPGPDGYPKHGLARIQWEGPWTAPGVPARAAYRHTHWIATITRSAGDIGIFDINALSNGSGWCSLQDWARSLVPWILEECVPRANGNWHLTHVD